MSEIRGEDDGDAAQIPLEIERKYLLTGRPPDMPSAELNEIVQGWLPGDQLRERLRRTTRDGESRFRR